ncbi:MAG: hypothetical protein ACRDFQ_03925 [Anaerolineales bacterium]
MIILAAVILAVKPPRYHFGTRLAPIVHTPAGGLAKDYSEVQMYAINQADTLLLMAAAMFFLGMCTLTMGMFVLVTRTMNRELKGISTQAAKMVQKGVAEDIAGLVGNASALLDGVSQLVKTAAGVGIFLSALGLGMMAAGYWIVMQVSWGG